MTQDEMNAFLMGGRRSDMTSYEQVAISEKLNRKPSGTSIAAITIAGAGLLAAVGAWVFGGIYANQGAKYNQRAIDLLASAQLQDRNMQHNWTLNNQPSLRNYIDVVAGAGAGAGAGSNANALATLTQLALNEARSGNVCPTPVALYQPAMPCACPGSCNG